MTFFIDQHFLNNSAALAIMSRQLIEMGFKVCTDLIFSGGNKPQA